MASRTEVELITKRETRSASLQHAGKFAQNQDGLDLQLRKELPVINRRISTHEEEPETGSSTIIPGSKEVRIPTTNPKYAAEILQNTPSAKESSPLDIPHNISDSQATCLGDGKFLVSTKSDGIWNFPESRVWVAMESKFPVPPHVQLRWPEIKHRLTLDLRDVEDQMVAEQANEKHPLKRSPNRRRVSPELRMSGRQNKFFSEFVAISPCIWVLCGSQSCRKKVRRITKAWSYPLNLFDQPIEVHEGAPKPYAKRHLVPLSRLNLDLERVPGLSYMGGFILHHLEAVPSTLERRSACGLLCCTTFLKDGKIVAQHISRIGGLLKGQFRDYSDNAYPIAITTSHGIFEDLGTDEADLDASEDAESFCSDDDRSDNEDSTDDDSGSDEDSSTESATHAGNVVQRSNAYHHRRLLGERSPDAVAEWLHVSLEEVVGVKFASSILPERISARLRRPRESTPGDYALLRPRNLATFQNTTSRLAELEITSYLINDELTEGCLMAVFGADNLSETSLLPGRITMPLGQETVSVRKVELKAPLAPGTSGTWLIRGSALAGIIIAAYPGQPLALFMTAQDIRETIVDTFPEVRRDLLWRKAAASFLDIVQDLGASSGGSGVASGLGKRPASVGKGHKTAPIIHGSQSSELLAKTEAIDGSPKKGGSTESSLLINPPNESRSRHKGHTQSASDSRSIIEHSENNAEKVSSQEKTRSLSIRRPSTSRSNDIQKSSKYTIIHVWTCCMCGDSGMTTRIDGCPTCGYRRCTNCPTFKTRIRCT